MLTKTDRQGHEVCTSLGRFIEEQGDVRTIVEELARRIDAIRDGTHPSGTMSDGAAQRPADASIAMQLEIEDLKTKVARLIEQSTQHTAQLGVLPTLTKKVELAENQIVKWRYRLPELTSDDDQPIIAQVIHVATAVKNEDQRLRTLRSTF